MAQIKSEAAYRAALKRGVRGRALPHRQADID